MCCHQPQVCSSMVRDHGHMLPARRSDIERHLLRHSSPFFASSALTSHLPVTRQSHSMIGQAHPAATLVIRLPVPGRPTADNFQGSRDARAASYNRTLLTKYVLCACASFIGSGSVSPLRLPLHACHSLASACLREARARVREG